MSEPADIPAFEPLPPEVRERLAACRCELQGARSLVVAFSGGVDSTLLLALAAATLAKANVLAVLGLSASVPQRERAEARRLAAELGVELVEIDTDELADPDYAANPVDRCYYCKDELFVRLKALAAERGFEAVASGANADDSGDFRPGLRAGSRRGVLTPLLSAGLTKADVRAASRAMGLPTWDKPAMACLASRVPYGRRITPDLLERIEQAEDVLRGLGFACCRVRDHETVARIEVPTADIERLLPHRRAIVTALKELGYTYVALDLAGFRSGSMNEAGPGR